MTSSSTDNNGITTKWKCYKIADTGWLNNLISHKTPKQRPVVCGYYFKCGGGGGGGGVGGITSAVNSRQSLRRFYGGLKTERAEVSHANDSLIFKS